MEHPFILFMHQTVVILDFLISHTHWTGATALNIASQNGHTETVQKLLTHPDINVNAAEESGG